MSHKHEPPLHKPEGMLVDYINHRTPCVETWEEKLIILSSYLGTFQFGQFTFGPIMATHGVQYICIGKF